MKKYRFRAVASTLSIVAAVASGSALSAIPKALTIAVTERVQFGLAQSIAIMTYDHGERDYFSYGRTDINGGATPTRHTVYEIGSVSKVFIAILLAEQVRAGRVALDDRIVDYLPASCQSESLKPITFAMLASHYAGLPRLPSNYAEPYYDLHPVGYSEQQLCAYLSAPQGLSPANVAYDYSNLGFELIGYLLPRISGKSLATLLQEVIIEPLQLHDTAIGINHVNKAQLAQGHHGNIRTAHFPNGMLDGAAAILSSPQDLMTLLAAYLQVLQTPDTSQPKAYPISLLNAIRSSVMPRKPAWTGTDIGLAWHIAHSEHGNFV